MVDEDLDDTHPMPTKRRREDFVAFQTVFAALDTLPADATPWQVAAQCASAVSAALEARAVLVLHHDEDRHEVRTIALHGPSADDLLGSVTSLVDDDIVTAVVANQKPLVLHLDDDVPRFVSERHRTLGAMETLLAFPVLRAGACVAIVEVVGVAEERHRTALDVCDLVGQRLAAALAS